MMRRLGEEDERRGKIKQEANNMQYITHFVMIFVDLDNRIKPISPTWNEFCSLSHKLKYLILIK